MIKFAVAGSRDGQPEGYVEYILGDSNDSASYARLGIEFLCVGCRGTDAQVKQWCKDGGVKCTEFPANCDKYGRAPGTTAMIREADLLIVFPGGPGTRLCVDEARYTGVKVIYAEQMREVYASWDRTR